MTHDHLRRGGKAPRTKALADLMAALAESALAGAQELREQGFDVVHEENRIVILDHAFLLEEVCGEWFGSVLLSEEDEAWDGDELEAQLAWVVASGEVAP